MSAENESAAAGDDNVIRCDACPVLCRIRPGRLGACDRYANQGGRLVRTAPSPPATRWCPSSKGRRRGTGG